MLPTSPDPLRIALNRVTFGARDLDVQIANSIGFGAWVGDQLNAPTGDDPELAAHLAEQTMHIQYGASDPANTRASYPAVNEDRPLAYLNASTPTLWDIARNGGGSIPFAEYARVLQELAAATWIRNTHSKYQLREFMVDFWHNHFNVGKNENRLATGLLPVYDATAIRPYALGNFRQMLEANATSSSMLVYLDNWVSTAATPNENYAREIMELHTLGGTSYLGTADPAGVPRNTAGVAVGFTDQDIVQVSRALSGWALKAGQRGEGTANLPNTGEFVFNGRQHNTHTGNILGINIAPYSGIVQGQKFLDILAGHPATAAFICTKLAKRIFGDTPPQTVIDRATAAWLANTAAADQIAQVMRSILLGGSEIMTAPVSKVRRPYERILAMFRTTDMVVNANPQMINILDTLNDGLFAWPAPDGRPDRNAYWLSTGANLRTWNLLQQIPYLAEIKTSLAAQAPASAATSASAIVDYWVGRMIGYQLAPAAMAALVTDQAGGNGVPASKRSTGATNSATIATRVENAHRRLVSLIATTEEFTLR